MLRRTATPPLKLHTTLPSHAVGPPGGRPAHEPALISARGVSKAFRLPHERHSTVKHLILHPLRSWARETLGALRDVSFDVPRGELLGIVGRNGSGKSTLLRCLAGIYPIDSGELTVRGRVAPFIELGVGFNPEMAARDNVIINAVMLGMTPRQARQRLEEIIVFAELEDFVDVKLKNYSSGMIVRLAFSITVHVDAAVLLFDEVLAVGDAAFQQKCFARFHRMTEEAKTILLVTHEMGLVERFCDRALLLEDGALVELGDPATVARRYAQLNAASTARHARPADVASGPTGGAIRGAWFEDPQGHRVQLASQGQSCCACVEATFHEVLEDPAVEVVLRDSSDRIVFVTSSRWAHGPTGSFGPGRSMVARVRFENYLAPGRYTLSASLARDAGALLDEGGDLAEVIVAGPRTTGGVADLPHEFEIDGA